MTAVNDAPQARGESATGSEDSDAGAFAAGANATAIGEASNALADGSTASDGFAALAVLDSNGDGSISLADVDFTALRVWQDANGDGVSQASEMSGLSDLGIVSIDANGQATSVWDNGNWIGLTAGYQTADGQTHEVADVWFATADAPVADAGVQLVGVSQPPVDPLACGG